MRYRAFNLLLALTRMDQNAQRSKHEPEFELLDTGIFNTNRYFDVFAEYSKATSDGKLVIDTPARRY